MRVATWWAVVDKDGNLATVANMRRMMRGGTTIMREWSKWRSAHMTVRLMLLRTSRKNLMKSGSTTTTYELQMRAMFSM